MTEADARLSLARPALQKLVEGRAPNSSEKAYRNVAMHSNLGCGVEQLPRTSQEAKRQQRGGRSSTQEPANSQCAQDPLWQNDPWVDAGSRRGHSEEDEREKRCEVGWQQLLGDGRGLRVGQLEASPIGDSRQTQGAPERSGSPTCQEKCPDQGKRTGNGWIFVQGCFWREKDPRRPRQSELHNMLHTKGGMQQQPPDLSSHSDKSQQLDEEQMRGARLSAPGGQSPSQQVSASLPGSSPSLPEQAGVQHSSHSWQQQQWQPTLPGAWQVPASQPLQQAQPMPSVCAGGWPPQQMQQSQAWPSSGQGAVVFGPYAAPFAHMDSQAALHEQLQNVLATLRASSESARQDHLRLREELVATKSDTAAMRSEVSSWRNEALVASAHVQRQLRTLQMDVKNCQHAIDNLEEPGWAAWQASGYWSQWRGWHRSRYSSEDDEDEEQQGSAPALFHSVPVSIPAAGGEVTPAQLHHAVCEQELEEAEAATEEPNEEVLESTVPPQKGLKLQTVRGKIDYFEELGRTPSARSLHEAERHSAAEEEPGPGVVKEASGAGETSRSAHEDECGPGDASQESDTEHSNAAPPMQGADAGPDGSGERELEEWRGSLLARFAPLGFVYRPNVAEARETMAKLRTMPESMGHCLGMAYLDVIFGGRDSLRRAARLLEAAGAA